MDSTRMFVYAVFGVVGTLAIAGAIAYVIARRMDKKLEKRVKEK